MPTVEELVQRIEGLEERLRAAEDVQAIVRLKGHYAELVDARYTRDGVKDEAEVARLAREIGQLFTADAVWDGGPGLGLCEGRDAIRERLAKPTLRFAWHYFVKPRIEVSGDTARGTWDILSPCTTARGKPMWMAGVERDEYARGDGIWRHTRMALELVFMSPYESGWAPRERAE